MAKQDRDVYDKGPPAAPAAAPEPPSLLDRLMSIFSPGGQNRQMAHQGKTVDQTVNEAETGKDSLGNKF